MEFTVELYETPDGRPVVEEELETIERTIPMPNEQTNFDRYL